MTRVTANSLTLSELADLVSGHFSGSPEYRLSGVASLIDATSQQLSFYHSSRYKDDLKLTKAGAIIVPLGTPNTGNRSNSHACYWIIISSVLS